MSVPSLLLAIGTLLILEILILALRRFGRDFRGGVLFHCWAIAMAVLVSLQGSAWAAADPLPWQILCTTTLILTTLVVYSLIENFVLIRRRDPARPPLIPRLLHQVIRFLLVLATFIFALNTIHGLPLPTVLVSSTVVSAVLGLALQDVLKNVFAGIALQLEGAPRVGDWLEVDGRPARIEGMSWRATRLRTNEGVDLIEPNSHFADRRLSRLGDGRRPVAFTFRVGLPYEAPPAKVRRALLAAAGASAGVLPHPEPLALLHAYGDSAIEYDLRVWTRDVDRITQFRSVVNSRIWYQIQRAGLYVPFPIRTVHVHQADHEEAEARQQELARITTLLAESELFTGLAPEAHRELAAGTKRLHFDHGEALMREGDPGDSMFILDRGQVAVTKSGQKLGTSTIGLAALKTGDFFGEMSLLTGEPRNATVVATTGCEAIELPKDALAPLLEARPEVVEVLSEVLMERSAATDEALEQKKEETLSRELDRHDPTTFVRKIRSFFRLSSS